MNHDQYGTIAELWRYPVKSMQGERIDTAELTELGISGDRRYALRDLTAGNIISAKVPSVGRPLLSCTATTHDDTVIIDIDGDTYDINTDRSALDTALTSLLGRPVRIEHAGTEPETYTSEWPELDDMALSDITIDLPLHHGSFADLTPLHLLTTTSLKHLQHLDANIDVNVQRFRPGIVIEPHAPDDAPTSFVENDWTDRCARIGDAHITFGAASPRCIMVTLEQPGLDADKQILRTIAEHNRRDFAGFGNFACLGIYADINTNGTIRVGDTVEPVACTTAS